MHESGVCFSTALISNAGEKSDLRGEGGEACHERPARPLAIFLFSRLFPAPFSFPYSALPPSPLLLLPHPLSPLPVPVALRCPPLSLTPAVPDNILPLHLVSDSTGQTVSSVARAVIVLFPDRRPEERHWILVRSSKQMDRAIAGIRKEPGPILYTLLDQELRAQLEAGVRDLPWPCVSVLDPVISRLAARLGAPNMNRRGRQHALDEEYFRRIDAMHFAVELDDGRNEARLAEAEVVLVGVSRSSKTPTGLYLANYGLRVANIPLVAGAPLPPFLARHSYEHDGKPMIVGLIKDARALGEIRRNRLRSMARGRGGEAEGGAGGRAQAAGRLAGYADHDAIMEELGQARRLFAAQGWPVVDVTRRSIEETAAEILALLEKGKGGGAAGGVRRQDGGDKDDGGA